MRTPGLDAFSRIFLIAAMAEVAGLFLGRTLIPGSGAIAVLALAGLVWSRPLPPGAYPWTRTTVVAGLGLLALVADRPDIGGPLEGGIVAAGCALIGAGVLGRVDRLIRPAGVPAVTIPAGLLVAMFHLTVAATVLTWPDAADLPRGAAVMILPVLGGLLVVVAAITALATRGGIRWAGAGLLPLVVLALSAPSTMLNDPHPVPPDEQWVMSQGITDVRPMTRGPDVYVTTVPVGSGRPAIQGRVETHESLGLAGEGGTHFGAALLAGMLLLGAATVATRLTAAEQPAVTPEPGG